MFPYRVDRDPSVRIPIEEIEKKIADSKICFAEITTDNPNVWYELGFACACARDLVLICCDEERKNKFPFDIQHRHIITYSTNSKSDFVNLENTITERIKALLSTSRTVQKISSSPVLETEGLEGHEVAALLIFMENIVDLDDYFLFRDLKEYMCKAGYTNIATNIAVRSLNRKGMIEVEKNDIENNIFGLKLNELSYKLTKLGEDWILNNRDKIKFRKTTNSANDSR